MLLFKNLIKNWLFYKYFINNLYSKIIGVFFVMFVYGCGIGFYLLIKGVIIGKEFLLVDMYV